MELIKPSKSNQAKQAGSLVDKYAKLLDVEATKFVSNRLRAALPRHAIKCSFFTRSHSALT